MDRRSGRFRPPDQHEWVQPCYVTTVPCGHSSAHFYSSDGSQHSAGPYPYWQDCSQQQQYGPAYGYPQQHQLWAGPAPPPPPPRHLRYQHAPPCASSAAVLPSSTAADTAGSVHNCTSAGAGSAAPPHQPEPSTSTPCCQPHHHSELTSSQQHHQLVHLQQYGHSLPQPYYLEVPHRHHMMAVSQPPPQYFGQAQYAPQVQYYEQYTPATVRSAGQASTSARTGHAAYLPGHIRWQDAQQQRATASRGSRPPVLSCAASQPPHLSASLVARRFDRQPNAAPAPAAASHSGQPHRTSSSTSLGGTCRQWGPGQLASAESSCHISDGDDDSTCDSRATTATPPSSAALPPVSPNFHISACADDWSTLTESLLQKIVLRLGNEEIKHVRLVGRHWRAVVDHNIEQLSPNVMCSVVIVTRFRNLRVLHLTNCANVRNRDLMIIAKSGLRLHTLTLGDDTTKPWVTNKGLAHIAKMPTLTALHLQDCNSVTNNGIACFNALRKLTILSLKGCRKLTNSGLETLQSHTALTSLNLFGCIKIGDEGLAPLAKLGLVTLTLGMTRIRDEGVKHLSSITTLQELSFSHEEMTYAGLKHLSGLTNLQSLALRENLSLNGEALVEVVPQLSKLQALDLFHNGSFRDDQLARCLSSVGNVTFLDLRGTSVTQDGIHQLSQLGSLQKLCVQPPHVDMWEPYMLVLANLTQLVSLTINNCTVLSMRLLGSLRPLHRLLELDLSDDKSLDVAEPKDHVQTQHVEVMASLSSLTSLDLSRRPIGEQHLVVLAERLPRLRSLFVVGCPVHNDEVTSLQRRFPDLAIHRKPLSDGSSCSSSEVGY